MRLAPCALALSLASCGSSSLPSSWTLTAPGITVEIDRAPYAITVRDASGSAVLHSLGDGGGDGFGSMGFTTGHTFWSNFASQGYYGFDAVLDPWRDHATVIDANQQSPTELDLTLSIDNRVIHVSHSLRASALRVEASVDGGAPRAWEAAFASPADEAFLGTGERYDKVNQRGLDPYCWPEEGGLTKGEKAPASATNPWPNGESMTYYPVPFFISSKGYGFWLDTTWRNQFNFASQRKDAWRAWHIGQKLAYEVYVANPSDSRPWPYHLIDSFTAATGRPMVPPDWSFGPRRRIDRGAMQNGVPEVQAMRSLGLALSVVDDALHFLPDGSDVGHESDLAAWTAQNAKLGCRTIAYYNPYLADDPNNPLIKDVQTGLSNHWFLRNDKGDPSKVWLISGGSVNVYTVDFTSSAATAWYQAMFQRALGLGYSGWMYDFGEYVQPDVLTSTGLTGEEFHNEFPVVYQKAAHDGLTSGDTYWFVRSGYTGASHYSPMVWSGDPDASFSDAEGLPAMARAGITMGISGVANWGSDIGGYKCLADGSQAADGELIARWIELGSMSSNMHDENSCSGGDMPKANIWTSMDAQAAWAYYAKLHTRLLPYLTSLAAEANATGAPLIRHLFLEHPESAFADVADAWYFGPSLLAAPVVTRGARSRTLALPPGNWLDWREQTLLTGGTTVTLNAPLDELPLLIRDGRLVPMLDPSIDTTVDGDHPGVIGPTDVSTVYDVVGLLSSGTNAMPFKLTDGTTLSASLAAGGFIAPNGFNQAANEADLASCDGCYRVDNLAANLARVRLSTTQPDVAAGGLGLHASGSKRRIRWDVYIVTNG